MPSPESAEPAEIAEVSDLSTPSNAEGEIALEFLLRSDSGGTANVELIYSTDGGLTWYEGKTTSTTTGLAASPDGTAHTIVWDSVQDLGFRTTDVQVAVQVKTDAAPIPDGLLAASLAPEPTGTIKQKRVRVVSAEVSVKNLEAAARRIDHFFYYLGAWDADKVAVAERHDLVVLDASQPTVDRTLIAQIQDGQDPADPTDDVIVLGYLNIGEDRRTIGVPDTTLLQDPRFVGDGSGPRVDPRGPGAAGQPLTGLDPLGLPSVAGGCASYYLDDNSVESDGVGDGVPDRNGYTGACYVNAGAPEWYAALQTMTLATDGVAGIQELLTTTAGNGYGVDGLFLERIDTCSPNTWTGPSDPNQVEFEWTAGGFSTFIAQLREDQPDAVLMQNRGLFFFDPDTRYYPLSTREHLDYVGFSSYRLDASTAQAFDPYHFANNKHNVVPRLQAEAYRPDGFQLLSIGHAAGPKIDPQTLIANRGRGRGTLLRDIREAQRNAGMRHYLTDAGSGLVNSFVADNADMTDDRAPVWNSTYNENDSLWPTPPQRARRRVGIREIVPGPESLTVRWGVALDLHPVHYVLYYDDEKLSFDEARRPSGTRIELDPEVGEGYELGVGSNTYPYQATISGLPTDTRHWCCIRAVDSEGNEDVNRRQLNAWTLSDPLQITIDGKFRDWKYVRPVHRDKKDAEVSAGPDWRAIKLHNDGDNLYVYFASDDPFNLDGAPLAARSHTLICIDVDANPFTGYRIQNIGSELLFEGGNLYRQAANAYATGWLQSLDVNPRTDIKRCEFAIPLAQLDAVYGTTVTRIRMTFINDDAGDYAPNAGHVEFHLQRD